MMNQHRSTGLQWKLAAVYLAVSVLSAGAVAFGYNVSESLGNEPATALVAGIAAGFLVGLVGSGVGFLIARSIKLRLWDAADMAGRIARGDYTARLQLSNYDDIGYLEFQLNEMAAQLETAVCDLRCLAEQNRRLAEEARRGAALEERARLARDLHDGVNQQLFVLAMRAAAARRKLEKQRAEAVETLVPELVALEELSRQAHGEARQLILQLRPTTLEQQGLGPALEEYVKATAAKEGWQVTTNIDMAIRLEGTPGDNLFRVAQEALNNVSKHARAKNVWVDLVLAEEGIRLTIRDDGTGFDVKAGVRPTAVGLVGMQERVAAMGGTLKVKSGVGRGTELTVLMPVEGGSGT